MRIGRILILLFIGLFMLNNTSCTAEPNIPLKPTDSFYVQDSAGVLNNASRHSIVETGRQLERLSKAQIVVVTVPTIAPYSLEEYANTLFRQWGIGDKKLNNGVLLLIAVNDRQARIEVGYGLEGALPDGKTKLLMERHLIPHLKNNDFNSGVLLLYRELVRNVAIEYKVADKIPALSANPHTATAHIDKQAESFGLFDYLLYAIIGLIMLLIFIFNPSLFFTLLQILSIIAGRGGRGGGSSGGGSSGGGGSNSRW